MESLKEKNNAFFNLILKHKFISALILCAVTSAVYLALSRFNVTAPNDDYCIFKVLNGGNTAIPCVGYFLAAFCVMLQTLFLHLNTYMCLQELICFFSLTAVNYFFIAKLGAKKGLFFSIIFNVIYLSFLIKTIIFTHTAAVASVSGFLCLVYGGCYESRQRYKILQIIAGFLFCFFGSQLRLPPFETCCVICAVYFVSVCAAFVFKNRKKSDFKKTIQFLLKKYLFTSVLLLAAVIGSFGLNLFSESIKNTDKAYREIVNYNRAYSKVADARSSFWYFNQEELGKADIKSKSDMMTCLMWFVDDDFFTIERLDKIASAYKKDGIIKNNALEYIVDEIVTKTDECFKSGVFLIYVFILILAVFTIVLISIFKPKLGKIALRIGILVIIWGFCFFISDVFSNAIILHPLIALSFLIAVRYNDVQWIVSIALILVCFGLYIYLTSFRLLFYTAFCVIYPTFVFMIFDLENSNLIKAKRRIKLNRTTTAVFTVILLLVSVSTGVVKFIQDYPADTRKDNQLMEEYITNNPDKVFLVNQMVLQQPYYNPLLLQKEHRNVVNYGLWMKKAEYFKRSYKNNGINHLFKDTIDSNKYIVVYDDTVTEASDKSITKCSYLEDYYNNHYTEKGKTIKIYRDHCVGNYSLYKVTTQKKDSKRRYN